jgi:2-polyprenyl-3-methyl-5-hydroxy-6-metoxy-1,4-benzoquinol methylase
MEANARGLADVRPGTRVLDLACGTGNITYEVAARGAEATGLDVTRAWGV